MFSPHPNLAEEVNGSIIQSEIEGGVYLGDLPPSTVLHIQTMNHCYTAVLLGGSEALLSGHPEFGPEPVQVAISGSTWGGSMLKLQFVGRGMHLEFRHPQYPMPIVTSPIPEIRDNVALPAMGFDGRGFDIFSFFPPSLRALKRFFWAEKPPGRLVVTDANERGLRPRD